MLKRAESFQGSILGEMGKFCLCLQLLCKILSLQFFFCLVQILSEPLGSEMLFVGIHGLSAIV